MRVHTRHVRQAKLCGSGLRTWLIHKGYTRAQIRDYFLNGMPIDELEKHDDPFAHRVLEAVRAEAERKEGLTGG